MNQQFRRVQWIQLTVLSGVHFLVDMLGNLFPAILPVIVKKYGISLFVVMSIPIFLSLSANGVQILTGRMRPDKTAPFFLHIGMILAAGMCLMALAPRSPAGVVLLFAASLVGCNKTGSLRFSAVQGMARLYPLACAGTIVAGLSTAGFPLLAGTRGEKQLVRDDGDGMGEIEGRKCLGRGDGDQLAQEGDERGGLALGERGHGGGGLRSCAVCWSTRISSSPSVDTM